jgi:hypothetical protein
VPTDRYIDPAAKVNQKSAPPEPSRRERDPGYAMRSASPIVIWSGLVVMAIISLLVLGMWRS